MSADYLVPGQDIGSQTEDNFGAATRILGSYVGIHRVTNVPVGSVAYASFGTNTAGVANQNWITSILVPYRKFVTKVGFLQGGTATTIVAAATIWDSRGNVVGYSDPAGVVLSGANTFAERSIVFNAAGAAVTGVQLFGPQQYFVGISTDTTTAGALRTVAASTFLDVLSTTGTASFTLAPSAIGVPTSLTADTAPIVYLTGV